MLSHVVACCVISRKAFSLFAFNLEASRQQNICCLLLYLHTAQAVSQNSLLLCPVRKVFHFSAQLKYSFLIIRSESADPEHW